MRKDTLEMSVLKVAFYGRELPEEPIGMRVFSRSCPDPALDVEASTSTHKAASIRILNWRAASRVASWVFARKLQRVIEIFDIAF